MTVFLLQQYILYDIIKKEYYLGLKGRGRNEKNSRYFAESFDGV